jgi:hypothetical protein
MNVGLSNDVSRKYFLLEVFSWLILIKYLTQEEPTKDWPVTRHVALFSVATVYPDDK